MPKPPLTPSVRASAPARRGWRSSRRAQASARRSAIWRPRACGRRRTAPDLWVSTYTRNLQRQIVQELARLYPDPAEREEKAVVRKGRENYLCLLNYEEAAKRTRAGAGTASGGARIDRALGAGDIGRRHVGRGLSVVSRGLCSARRIDRPARRMRLRGVPALPAMFHRARHPAFAPCADRRRQPCARHRAGLARLDRGRDDRYATRAARALCLRRRPSSLRCGGLRLLRVRLGFRDGGVAALDTRT